MAEYIKREDAYTTLTDYYHHSTEIQHLALKEALDRVPAAEVVPTDFHDRCMQIEIAKRLDLEKTERKTGRWIYPSDIIGFGRCSECKALWDYSLMINKSFKICPRCGSYNRGDDNV